jgi:hypothetical protein
MNDRDARGASVGGAFENREVVHLAISLLDVKPVETPEGIELRLDVIFRGSGSTDQICFLFAVEYLDRKIVALAHRRSQDVVDASLDGVVTGELPTEVTRK